MLDCENRQQFFWPNDGDMQQVLSDVCRAHPFAPAPLLLLPQHLAEMAKAGVEAAKEGITKPTPAGIDQMIYGKPTDTQPKGM